MDPVTVYRSGGLTPYDEIRNPNSEEFDSISELLTKRNPNRCSSVYAGLNLEEVETVWSEYRSYSQQLDDTIYKIVIPAELLNEDIYAYNLEAYDEYWFQKMEAYDESWSQEKAANNEPLEGEEAIKDYMDTSIHISDWEDALRHLSPSELRHYEVLIPHHIAVQCEWSIVSSEDREEWYRTMQPA